MEIKISPPNCGLRKVEMLTDENKAIASGYWPSVKGALTELIYKLHRSGYAYNGNEISFAQETLKEFTDGRAVIDDEVIHSTMGDA